MVLVHNNDLHGVEERCGRLLEQDVPVDGTVNKGGRLCDIIAYDKYIVYAWGPLGG